MDPAFNISAGWRRDGPAGKGERHGCELILRFEAGGVSGGGGAHRYVVRDVAGVAPAHEDVLRAGRAGQELIDGDSMCSRNEVQGLRRGLGRGVIYVELQPRGAGLDGNRRTRGNHRQVNGIGTPRPWSGYAHPVVHRSRGVRGYVHGDGDDRVTGAGCKRVGPCTGQGCQGAIPTGPRDGGGGESGGSASVTVTAPAAGVLELVTVIV